MIHVDLIHIMDGKRNLIEVLALLRPKKYHPFFALKMDMQVVRQVDVIVRKDFGKPTSKKQGWQPFEKFQADIRVFEIFKQLWAMIFQCIEKDAKIGWPGFEQINVFTKPHF